MIRFPVRRGALGARGSLELAERGRRRLGFGGGEGGLFEMPPELSDARVSHPSLRGWDQLWADLAAVGLLTPPDVDDEADEAEADADTDADAEIPVTPGTVVDLDHYRSRRASR